MYMDNLNPKYAFIPPPYSTPIFANTPKYRIKTAIKKWNEEEILTCEKIKKIPSYFCFFSPILKTNFLNIDEKYVLLHQEVLIPFHEFFRNLPEKQVEYFAWASFFRLIDAFKLLNSHGILYTNYGKIGFTHQNQPVLFDFERNIQDLQYLPLEQHVAIFLENNSHIEALSKTNITDICFEFNKNKYDNKDENEDIREKTHEKCMNLLMPWINQPKSLTLNEMNKYKNTWDIYSLSMLYLNLINIYPIISTTFPVYLLYKNIQLDGKSR